MRRMTRAFTLIEVLVVVVILGILASLLFPIFAQSKSASKRAMSVSNLQQIGLAHYLYNNDYDGRFSTSWAKGWMGDWSFFVQPYMKNTKVLMDPSRTINPQDLEKICGENSNDPYGGYYFTGAGAYPWRDNPTHETQLWGYGFNNGVRWSDDRGLTRNIENTVNPNQQISIYFGGQMVQTTVRSWPQVGIPENMIANPSMTFMMANSGEPPRSSIQLEAMSPPGAPNVIDSPCFRATHAGMPYYGGNIFLFTDGHVHFETYVGTPSAPWGLGGGMPVITRNPCRYYSEHDPNENFENCMNGWK